MPDHTSPDNAPNVWQMDKKVPLTLIFLVVMQTGTFIWSASTLSNDVKNLRESTSRLEKQLNDLSEKFERRQELFYSRDEALREFSRVDTKITDIEKRLRTVERTAPISKSN